MYLFFRLGINVVGEGVKERGDGEAYTVQGKNWLKQIYYTILNIEIYHLVNMCSHNMQKYALPRTVPPCVEKGTGNLSVVSRAGAEINPVKSDYRFIHTRLFCLS